MLRNGTFYKNLGADHFRRASPETRANRLARQIEKLGFTCSLAPAGVSIEMNQAEKAVFQIDISRIRLMAAVWEAYERDVRAFSV